MLRILKYLVFLLVLLVVGVIALPFVLPPAFVKAQIETFASDALDRELAIDGDLSLSFWPPLSVSATDVRLANAPGLEPATMVKFAALDLTVDALAYFNGVAKLDRLVLRGPEIDLHIDENGQGNWPGPADAGATQSDSSSGGGKEPLDLPRIALGEIAILDGRIGLVDRANDLERSFDDINLRLSQTGTDGPIAIDGAVVQGGEPAELGGQIADPLALAQGGSSALELLLAVPGGSIQTEGTIDGGQQALDLAIAVDFGNPRQLADWLGQPLDMPENVLNSIALKTQLVGDPQQMQFQGLSLALDDIKASGELNVNLGSRPKIAGALNFAALTLERYLGEQSSQAENQVEGEADAAAANQGWPEDPIDLPLPLPVDLDLAIGLDGLTARKLEIGKTSLTIAADATTNALTIHELAVYEGAVSGALQLAAGEPHALSADIKALGIEIFPILQATAEIDKLEGKGNVELAVASSGASVKALVEGLNGQGAILLRDGAIIGFNIGAVMRSVMTLGVNQEAREVQRTDFAELGGTFAIENGVVSNQDLAMRAPTLRVDGAGTIDLPSQSLDYRLRPAIAGTLQGQDATAEEAFKTGVPLAITGPWAKPDIQIELNGTLTGDLTDPKALAATLGAIANDSDRLANLKSQLGLEDGAGLGDALGALLGGGSDGGEAASDEDGQSSKDVGDAVGDALGGLLGNSGSEGEAPAAEDESGSQGPSDASQRAVDALGTLLGR